MSACLPLWLVKYGGAPVALVAEVDRSSAARAANASLIRDAALGDITALTIGTGRPGARGIVCPLGDHDAQRSDVLETDADQHQRYAKKAPSGKASKVGVAALDAACKASKVAKGSALRSTEDTCACVRWAVWVALQDAGFNYVEIGKVTGHHRSTVDRKVDIIRAKSVPDKVFVKYSTAYAAAADVLAKSASQESA